MARLSDLDYLGRAIEVSRRARANGNHPFGCILVDADGAIVLEAENSYGVSRDATGHAETNLMRAASIKFERDYLAGCLMFTSIEPCCMCAGALYWAGVGGVVFGATEARLLELTGSHPENPTLNMPCRRIFATGQREITVRGPFPEIEDEVLEVHAGFWD